MKFLVTILVILIIMAGNKLTNDNEKREKEKKNNTTTTYKPTQTTTKKEDNKDPLSLSMKTNFYYVDPQLRKYLSHTNLEYPSKVEYIEKSHYRYSWVLKSNNKEVYALRFLFKKGKEKMTNTQTKQLQLHDNFI